MNSPHHEASEVEEEEEGDVFLDKSDIIYQETVDEEDDLDSDPDDSVQIFTGHTSELYTVVCSPAEPTLVATGGGDNKGFMWRIGQGDWATELQGKLICTGSGDATLRIWNPRCGQIIHVIRGHPYHTEGLTCLALSSDSTLAITGSLDNSIHVVNITTGRVVSSLASHSDSVECVGFAPSFPWAASGSMDKKLIIWDLQHSSPRCTCSHEDGVTCLTWLGATKYVATGCSDRKVRVWDSLSGNCTRTFSCHSGSITSLTASGDGNFLVSASADRTARVFEISEFK